MHLCLWYARFHLAVSVYVSVCLSVCMSLCLFVCVHVRLSVLPMCARAYVRKLRVFYCQAKRNSDGRTALELCEERQQHEWEVVLMLLRGEHVSF